MEDSSLGHGELHTTRLPTSFSTNSLDIKLLLRANRMQSLLSESVTLDSLRSNAFDSLPAFPPSKLPSFTLVGLGDHLKLFSTTTAQQPAVRISTPTLPRLKCMLKECLSIKQWAEGSTGWQAPGHVPWKSVEKNYDVHNWVAEGSAFSPERFSLALLAARSGVTELGPISLFSFSSGVSPGSLARTGEPENSIHADISGKSHEHGRFEPRIESCADDTPTNDWNPNQTSSKLVLPSLVVSDSYFTFPVPSDSSSTLAGGVAGTRTHRRGKKPPRLLLGQRHTIFDLPYPDIPTAFLGSSPNTLENACPAALGDNPPLGFEEMINNLRLQCSSMRPQTPPTDTSWNSRSPLEPYSPTVDSGSSTTPKPGDKDQKRAINKIACPEARSASIVRSVGVRPQARPIIPPLRRPARRAKAADPPAADARDPPRTQPKTVAPSPVTTATRVGNAQVKASTSARPPKAPALNPRQPRSAMAKATLTTKHVPKKVRFALTRHDLDEDDLPSSYHANPKAQSVPEDAVELSHKNTQTAAIPNTTQKVPLQRSTSWAQRPPWKDLRRVRSVASPDEPRTQSLLLKSSTVTSMFGISAEAEDINVEPRNGNDTLRSTSSMGRHSLSRIIKGPIFAYRDTKRATISMSGGFDENAGRRESQSQANIHQKRKSRMPIPLRNILTRFK